MADQIIGLAAAIAALRQELFLASGSGEGSDMRFRISSIDLSLQVAATKEGGGKIGWTVLGLGASYESATTQTLTLTLEPLWRKPSGAYTSDFTVSDQDQLPAAFGPQN
jgi:NTP-dependent ternary system trypsin peptidase co-occuring protein